MDRIQKLRSIVDATGFGLEIGPSHNPVFPKAEGFNVEIMDWTDADTLKAHYGTIGIDTSRIESVDYISGRRPLEDVVPRRGEYDFVFSSHAIEHVTDVVSYIKGCELLLKPEGVLALAIPDKRYMFDFLRPISTVGQILEAYGRRHTKHSPASVYDFMSMFALLDGKDSFSNLAQGQVTTTQTVRAAYNLFLDSLPPTGQYHDVHGWIFTPSSFRLIMSDLRELGLVEVSEFYMQEQGALEFHVGLRRGSNVPSWSRIELLQAILREQVESGLQLLAGTP